MNSMLYSRLSLLLHLRLLALAANEFSAAISGFRRAASQATAITAALTSTLNESGWAARSSADPKRRSVVSPGSMPGSDAGTTEGQRT